MKKLSRKHVRAICFTFAAVAVLSICAYKEHLKAEYYRHEALAFARQAASELATSAEELNLTLTKCTLSPSDEFTRTMCTKLYGTCLVTSAAIDALPWQHELENLTSMLEEAKLMALRGAQTGKIDVDEIAAMKNDFEITAQLLNEVYNSYNGAVFSFGNSLIDPYNSIADNELSDAISQINDSASKHVAPSAQPKQAKISSEEAQAKSARIIGCEMDDIIYSEVTGNFGTIYYCTCDPFTIGINGEGTVVYYSDTSQPGGDGIETQDAIAAVESFVSDISGMDADIMSYRVEDGYMRSSLNGGSNEMYDVDTPIYTTIDMSTGKIASYDAVEFYSAASLREELYKEFTANTTVADITLPDEADANSKKLCIIRMPWDEQYICIRYSADDGNGKKYNIYYDAVSGIPVDLRIITENENELQSR